MKLPRLSRHRALCATLALTATVGAHATPVTVDLPQQPLSVSILQLVKLSGQDIAVDSALVEGKRSPAVKGTLEPLAALNQLLAGSGLVAAAVPNGSLVVRPADGVALKEIRVVDSKPVDGSVEAGYRNESAQVILLSPKPLLDTPFTVQTVPSALLENQQATTLKEATRYAPSVITGQEATFGGFTRFGSRGVFSLNVFSNSKLEGIDVNLEDVPLEDKERVEFFVGAPSGFYGFASPAGIVNFVLKRPTEKPLANVTISAASRGTASLHLDLGGRFGSDEVFGYRLNAVKQGGDYYWQNSSLDRELLSAALDWRITRDTLLELDASRYEYTLKGAQGRLQVGNLPTPPAPDPSKLYGQPWAKDNASTNGVGLRATWNFAPQWKAQFVARSQDYGRDAKTITDALLNRNGDYRSTIATTLSMGDMTRFTGEIGSLSGRVDYAGIQHDLMLVARSTQIDTFSLSASSGALPFTSNLSNPTYVSESSVPVGNLSPFAQRYRTREFVFGDVITFSEQWIANLFLTHSSVDISTGLPGALGGRYAKSHVSPTIGLTFKPTISTSVYVSYIEALERGGVAPTTASNPPGQQVLPPFVSRQVEAGFKWLMKPELEATIAVYETHQPSAFVDPVDNIFKTLGDARIRGTDLRLVGRVAPQVTAVTGLSLTDAELLRALNPAFVGNSPPSVPKY